MFSNTKRLTLSRKVLFSTSILLFLLATVHMAMELFSVYTLDDPINVTQASATVAILAVSIGAPPLEVVLTPKV